MQIADGLDFELPSDISDDEEIDEDMAFTEEDKKQYAGMFGDDGGASGGSDDGQDEEDLLRDDDSDASEAAEFDADVSARDTLLRLLVALFVAICTWLSLPPGGRRLHGHLWFPTSRTSSVY